MYLKIILRLKTVMILSQFKFSFTWMIGKHHSNMQNWQWQDNELRETEGLNAEANDDDKRPVSTAELHLTNNTGSRPRHNAHRQKLT